MKTINNFIYEKLNLGKANLNPDLDSMIKDINIFDFEWNSAYASEAYQDKCKKEVLQFADELYPKLKPYERIEQLFKDSYKIYGKSCKWSEARIKTLYDYSVGIIDSRGWSQFENFSLEQGWWAFMYWIYKQIN